ncbi:hypothetical protein FQ015_20790 [Escherichia sp. HH26CH]|nr:hypothetical protein [Escherichia sp. HH26CH]
MAIMPPVIMKSVMHYSITYALHSFLENDTQEYAVVKIDIAVILRRGRKRWAVTFHRPIRN